MKLCTFWIATPHFSVDFWKVPVSTLLLLHSPVLTLCYMDPKTHFICLLVCLLKDTLSYVELQAILFMSISPAPTTESVSKYLLNEWMNEWKISLSRVLVMWLVWFGMRFEFKPPPSLCCDIGLNCLIFIVGVSTLYLVRVCVRVKCR